MGFGYLRMTRMTLGSLRKTGFSKKTGLKLSLGRIDLRYLLDIQDDVKSVVKYMSLKMKDQLELQVWKSETHIWY